MVFHNCSVFFFFPLLLYTIIVQLAVVDIMKCGSSYFMILSKKTNILQSFYQWRSMTSFQSLSINKKSFLHFSIFRFWAGNIAVIIFINMCVWAWFSRFFSWMGLSVLSEFELFPFPYNGSFQLQSLQIFSQIFSLFPIFLGPL